MFKLLNTYTKDNLTLKVEHNGSSIEFKLSSIINKRNKDELAPDIQMELINKFLDWKGDAFKKELFNRLYESQDIIINYLTKTDIMPLPLSMVHNILDMFDMNEVFYFLKEVYRLNIPSVFKEEFDTKIEEDGMGTRVQTFIKTDYLELASLVTVLKTVIGPIAHFAYVKAEALGEMHKELILLNFLSTHPIYEYPAFVKIRGMIDMIIKSETTNPEENAIRLIERDIPEDELGNWILSITLFQKIILSSIIDDTSEKNVVTKIHNFVTNKLKLKQGVANTIRIKKPMLDTDSGEGESESIIESYRLTTDHFAATTVELEWAVSNLDNVINWLDPRIEKEKVLNTITEIERLKDHGIDETQLILLGWIIKPVIDPRALYYISLDKLVDLMAVAHEYLQLLGFKKLSLIFTALKEETSNQTVYLTTTVNRTRVTKELKARLDELFPNSKVIVSSKENKYVNPAEESINLLADKIFNARWILLTNKQKIIDALNEETKILTPPPELKVLLAELVIKLIEERFEKDIETD